MPEIVTIGLVSISTLIPHDQLDAGTNILIRAGYRVKVAPNVAQCCMAPPAERARLLEEFWLDPEIDLLLFARGGEGAVDVVPLLDWERLRARPDMPVMGFSDITVLLNAMLAKGVGHPISGPMLSYATRLTPEARDWSHRVLRGEELPVIVLSPILPRPPCGVAGSPRRGAEGALPMGGHVTRLHWLFTNGLAPSASNRVVFLECTAATAASSTARQPLSSAISATKTKSMPLSTPSSRSSRHPSPAPYSPASPTAISPAFSPSTSAVNSPSPLTATCASSRYPLIGVPQI